MPEERDTYSDEAREIMGRIPSWVTRWGICVIGCILLLLIAGCFVIKYPQTITASAIITTVNPPVDLIAKYDGRIDNLFVKNGQKVVKGEIIATLENTADYNSVVTLEKNLKLTIRMHAADIVGGNWISANYQLGELQSDFAQFQSVALEYGIYLSTNPIGKKQTLIKRQISQNAAYTHKLKEINDLMNKEMGYVKKGYERDSILYSTKTIAKSDIEKSARSLLQGKQSRLNSDASLSSAELQTMQNKQQLEELDLQRRNDVEEYERNLEKYRQELIADIDKWKENYAFVSPIDGVVTFIDYWSSNQRITAGERLAGIVPEKSVKVIGRLTVPSSGFGKVEKGQKVLVSLDGYPYMEFGKLKGVITSISAVPNKENNYQAEIFFPNGLLTTYKKKINFIQQMKGSGEIITKDARLIEQLINPIKSLFKNR